MEAIEEEIICTDHDITNATQAANIQSETRWHWATLTVALATWAQTAARVCLQRAELVRQTAPGQSPEREYEWKREWRDQRLVP